MALSPLRKHRITGSQAGAILGLSPFSSREDIMQDWLCGSTFTGNAATEYGTFHEEYAFADLPIEATPNDEFFIHTKYQFIGATPDGFAGDDAIVEIKCPFSLRNDENPKFKSINELPHYYAQLQLEMAASGRTRAYFFQWNRYASKLETVDLNAAWWEENLPKFYAFLAEFEQRKARLCEDELLAREYHDLKAQFDQAKTNLDECKERMIKLSNGNKRKFGDVSVYPVHRAGSVAYAKIIKEHMPDFDVEPYRGVPSDSWVVK